jgi:hypothetical protein
MPKYVFEQSIILPAGEQLTTGEAAVLAERLEYVLGEMARMLGHARFETAHDEPFEHVTGDNLPPDEHGVIKVGPARPIDL